MTGSIRPPAANESVAARMARQASKDTRPELALRRELHQRGLRFRLGQRPLPTLRSTPDIVFGPTKVAVYVDGCFWHSCPEHATRPGHNAGWWADKLARNRERDRKADAVLAAAGWAVVRVWEHESPSDAADQVEGVVRQRQQTDLG